MVVSLVGIKTMVCRIPVAGPLARFMYRAVLGKNPPVDRYGFHSRSYWERRYADGGDSGAGSYGKLSLFKAEVINRFLARQDIESVIEFGCGDGHQLALGQYPRYLGLDVSHTVIDQCRMRFAEDNTKRFLVIDDYGGQHADLALSLDVIYHLVEDDVFHVYMNRLFDSASRFVIVYSSNTDNNRGNHACHVRHRKFSRWIKVHASGWKLSSHIPSRYPYRSDKRDGSFADFYIYVSAKSAKNDDTSS